MDVRAGRLHTIPALAILMLCCSCIECHEIAFSEEEKKSIFFMARIFQK